MNKNNYMYAKFPNKLLEYLMSSDLNAAEIKVVLCIARNTYGKRDEQCQMSVEDIRKETKLSESHSTKMIQRLIKKSILIEVKKYTATAPRCIAINSCYME